MVKNFLKIFCSQTGKQENLSKKKTSLVAPENTSLRKVDTYLKLRSQKTF